MNVMLLSLPGMAQDDGNVFPLGIGYLAGSLKGSHAVESLHFNMIRDAGREIPGRVRSFRPDVIGLTCGTFNRGFVRDAIRRLKTLDGGAPIVVGGVHASFCHEQMLRHYGADIVVVGEGERTFPELCSALDSGRPLRDVNGIAFLENGELVLTAPRPPVGNLDDLPMPDYSYGRPYIEKSGMGFLITSRGCPVRCTFCSTSSYWGQRVRVYSPSRVVDEMEMLLSEFRVRRIFFHDDTFNLGISRVKAICAEIVKRGLRVEWGCDCRVTPVSDEMLAAMVEAGCRHVCWGVESGSERILRSIDKKITLDQIRNAFNLSAKYSRHMSTGAFTMVGNPGETEETARETVNFLNTIPMTDSPSTSILYVLPGTVLYEELKRKGHIRDEDWVRHDAVPRYTIENSYLSLVRWSQRVNGSGNRIPFDPATHFWNTGSDAAAAGGRTVPALGKLWRRSVRLATIATRLRDYLLPGRLYF